MELWELTFLFSQWTHHLPFLLFQVEWQHFSLCFSLHPGESIAIWKVIIKKQTWNKWTTMKKRDIPNMMYMAVMPILIYQNDCIRMSLVIGTLYQFLLILIVPLQGCTCLIVFIFGNKISKSNGRQCYETKVDGVEEVPLLCLDKHKCPAEENSEDEKKTNPYWDRLGDVHLLPVLVLELVQILSACRPDPGRRHSSSRRGHLQTQLTTENVVLANLGQVTTAGARVLSLERI